MTKTLKLFKTDFYSRIGGLKQFKNKTVLDLGCGDGEDSVAISRFAKKVIGVDIEKNIAWKNNKSPNVKFIISKAEKLPFKDSQFDALFLKDVIHHVQNIEKTMSEIKRVTKPDARIVLIEGNRYNPLFFIHMTKMLGHEHLPQDTFKKLVTKYFKNSKFIHFESHFIPFVNETWFKKLITIEKFMEKLPFIKPLLSYNCALIN